MDGEAFGGNNFAPEIFYGESVEDIMNILHMNNLDSVNENEEIKHVIRKHIDRVRSNPVYVLPPIGEGFSWLNTQRPLDFQVDLGRKIYVMDFFTYCCINCMHILPLLKKIEDEFEDNASFAVIGVHSPKYPNEKVLEKLQDAVIRNGIKHPVINDYNHTLWRHFAVTCWPTVFIVGPSNMLLFILVGEIQISKLEFLLQVVFDYFSKFEEKLDFNEVPVSPLSKPGSILLYPENVSSNNELIAVTDTGHNRIVIMSRDLKVVEVIGSGIKGCEDGPYDLTSFSSPHGTTWYKNSLYVADTGNHSIRMVDLIAKKVKTVYKKLETDDFVPEELINSASTNRKNLEQPPKSSFKSPWDVCIGPELASDFSSMNVLYIAVAGSHQIWAMNLDSDNLNCVPFAGSGKEENKSNSYRFLAGFAQPSGIDYSEVCPQYLFVADSESSTIRYISLHDGAVRTLVGGAIDPLDLFSYGDIDGVRHLAQLQHPIGVCVLSPKFLAVADTYNHKIKFVEIEKRNCQSMPGEYGFSEPSGICIVDDILVIADTNNHKIHSLPIMKEHIISDLVCAPVLEVQSYSIGKYEEPITKLQIKYGGKIDCYFDLILKSKFNLTSDEQVWEVSFRGDGRFDILCNTSKLFVSQPISARCPSIVLKAEQYALEKVYDGSRKCCLTFTIHTALCDCIREICFTEEIIFKVLVEFLNSGVRNVKLNFVAVK